VIAFSCYTTALPDAHGLLGLSPSQQSIRSACGQITWSNRKEDVHKEQAVHHITVRSRPYFVIVMVHPHTLLTIANKLMTSSGNCPSNISDVLDVPEYAITPSVCTICTGVCDQTWFPNSLYHHFSHSNRTFLPPVSYLGWMSNLIGEL